MLGLGLSLTNFGTKGGVADTPDLSGSSAAAFLALWSTDGQGLVFDFADDQSVKIVDTSTPANNKDSSGYIPVSGALVGPGSVLTYTSPSPKLCLQGGSSPYAGYYAYQAHNLCLQSENWTTTWNPTAASGTGSVVTVTANYAANPVDGAMTASRLQFSLNGGTTSSDISKIYQSIAEVAGAKYSGYIWARSTDGTSSYAMQMLTPGGGVACTITGTWQKIEFSAVAAIGSASNFGLQLRGGRTPTNSNSADIIVHRAHKYLYPANTDYISTGASSVFALPYEWSAGGTTCQGIRVEEARTNLILKSNTFGTTWATSNATITENVAISPIGGLTTADLYTASSSAAQLYQLLTLADSTTYTGSIFVKRSVGSDWFFIRFRDKASATHNAWFNLSTGAKGSTSGTVSDYTITAAALPGWYRVTATFASATGATAPLMLFASATADAATTPATSDAVWVSAAQFEAGSFATSPIETYASTVTRAADNISIATSAFPSLGSAGTIYMQGSTVSGNTSSSYALELYTSGSAFAAIRSDSGVTAQGIVTTGGAPVAVPAAFNWTAGSTNKIAMRLETNNTNLCSNASLGTNDTSCTMPTYTTAFIGSNNGLNNLNGYIKVAAALPLAISDANLQTMTT